MGDDQNLAIDISVLRTKVSLAYQLWSELYGQRRCKQMAYVDSCYDPHLHCKVVWNMRGF